MEVRYISAIFAFYNKIHRGDISFETFRCVLCNLQLNHLVSISFWELLSQTSNPLLSLYFIWVLEIRMYLNIII